MDPAPPLVTIVLTSYNYERFIDTALDSALAQTYPHVEVIVVDDGSTDNSRELILARGDRVRALFQANGGQASAYNAGFGAARGDILIFLDADDVLYPDAAARVVRVMTEAPDTAQVLLRLDVVDAAGAPTGFTVPGAGAPMPEGDLRDDLRAFNNRIWWPPGTAHAYAAWALRRVFPVPEELPGANDYYTCRATALCGPVRSLPEPLGAYRWHGQNDHYRTTFSLAHTREEVRRMVAMHPVLRDLAGALGLPGYPRTALDTHDIRLSALRMAVARLDNAPNSSSPVGPGGDTRWRAWRAGTAAALAVPRLGVARRLAYLAWFLAAAAAPRPLVRGLAESFLHPEARPGRRRFQR